MKRLVVAALAAGLSTATIGTAFGQGFEPDGRVPPPRRYLTTFMAHYPFGVLREDYTPLGAPGVSKANYFGRPMRTATLHTRIRVARYMRRDVVRVRY